MEDTLEGILPGVPRMGRSAGKHGTDTSTAEMQLEGMFSRLRKIDPRTLKVSHAGGHLSGISQKAVLDEVMRTAAYTKDETFRT